MPAYPQTFPPPFGVTHLPTSPPWAGALGGFTGILDTIVTASAAAGSVARRLTGTSWGTIDSVLDPLCRIRRLSDSTEESFSYDGTNELDTAAIATFLSATTGVVVKNYDQSGLGRHWVQATASEQPAYLASGINGKPSADYDGVNDFLECTPYAFGWVGEDKPFDLICPASADTQASKMDFISITRSDDGNGFTLFENSTDGGGQWKAERKDDATIGKIRSQADTTRTGPLLHRIEFLGTSCNWFINGVALSGIPGDLDLGVVSSDQIIIGALSRNGGGGSNPFDGNTPEGIFFDQALPAGDRTLLETDLASFYGITLP